MKSQQNVGRLSHDSIKRVAGTLSFFEAYYVDGSLEQKNAALAARSLSSKIEDGLFESEEDKRKLLDVIMSGVRDMRERNFDLAYIYNEIRDAADIVRGAGVVA